MDGYLNCQSDIIQNKKKLTTANVSSLQCFDAKAVFRLQNVPYPLFIKRLKTEMSPVANYIDKSFKNRFLT